MKRTIAVAFVCGVLLAGCGSSNEPTNATNPVAPTTPSPSPAPAPAASRLELSASPSRLLLSGSTVSVTGKLTNAAGGPVTGGQIQFSTSSGSLSSLLPVTDQNGAVTVTLTGSASTTVLASAGGVNASLDVQAVAPFTVALDSKYSVIKPGDSDDLYVMVTPVDGFANAPAPSAVTLACGNGQTVVLGDKRIATCTYSAKDTYVATVTAATANGWSTTATTRISAEPTPISITLTAREVSRGPGEIEMELIAVGAPERSVCMWDLGEGTKRTGACNQNFVYALGDTDSDDHVTVKVTVDPKTGADQVTVQLTFTLKF